LGGGSSSAWAVLGQLGSERADGTRSALSTAVDNGRPRSRTTWRRQLPYHFH